MLKPACTLCGADLPPGTPEGLCPQCLLRVGLEPVTAGGASSHVSPPTAAHVPGRTPLSTAQLQKHFPQLEMLELLGQGGEARALARLSHPHIVAVYDFGRTADAGQPLFYFIMEYVEGVNLRQAMCARQVTPESALKIVPQICDALQFAHGGGDRPSRHQAGRSAAGV